MIHPQSLFGFTLGLSLLGATGLPGHFNRSHPAWGAQGQEKLNFDRAYKVGDTDRYQFKLSSQLPVPTSIDAIFVDKVNKIYPDGNADITETTESLTIQQGTAKNNNPPKPEPFPFKVSKYGILLGTAPNTPAGWVIFTLALPGENHGLAVGDTFNFKRKLSSASGSEVPPSVSGSVKLASISSGLAKLKVDSLLQPPTAGQKGSRITGVIFWDAKVGRYVSADLTVQSPTPTGTQAIHLVVRRMN